MQTRDGREFPVYNVTLQASWRDSDGPWKKSNNFRGSQIYALVIEDLLSTAGSSGMTVKVLRDEGKAYVTDVVSIFSYDFASAFEKARELKARLHPLTNITALTNVALSQMKISAEDAKLIDAFVKDP